MVKLRKAAEAFVVLNLLIILIVTSFNGISEGYNLDEQNLQDGKNVFQKLAELELLTGISKLSTGIQALGKIANPLDLVGALAISAMGVLQIIGGLVIFPLQIFGIITGFYDNLMPPMLTEIIGFLGVLAVGFIILKAKLGISLED